MKVLKLYQWLAGGPAPACDRVLGAALEHSDGEWFDRIVETLLARSGEPAWAELIGAYPRLSPAVRDKLRADPKQRSAAIALAIKSPTAAARAGALAAIEEDPAPRLAYVLPDALRDPSVELKARAAGLLRRLAEMVLADAPAADAAARQSHADDRREVALAAAQAFHNFDVHHRLEALEVGLWFALDLGEPLWATILNHRSRVGVVISERLDEWKSPLLAPFLLSALRRDGWRAKAIETLQACSGPRFAAEILRASELLDDPEICRHLPAIRAKDWFREIAADASAIPPDAMACAPRWVRHIGMRENERVGLLNRWIGSDDPFVHRAAVYAAADLTGDEARETLRQVSESASPLARFAKWCLLARDSDLVRAAEPLAAQQQQARQARLEPPPPTTDADREFILLWQVCRRTPPADRAELIDALRQRADAWRARFRAHLQSPDPRDRIVALQVVSTPALALRFRRELQALAEDPVDGIRRLAAALLQTVRQPPADASPFEPDSAEPPSDGDGDARHRLRDMLEDLATHLDAPPDLQTIRQLSALLSEAYPGAPREPVAGGA